MKTEAEYLSPREIQPIFGIGTTKVYAHINNGDFRAVKCGSKTLVDVASVRSYIATLPELPTRQSVAPAKGCAPRTPFLEVLCKLNPGEVR